MDTIVIKDLLARAIIGINEEERRNKQDVLMNILIHVDTSLPGKTDDFRDAVDYRAIKKEVFTMVEASSFFLLERLAEEVANICLEPEGVKGVEVTCEKPSALRFARSVGIQVRRTKDA